MFIDRQYRREYPTYPETVTLSVMHYPNQIFS